MAGAASFRRKMRRRRTKNCGKQGIGGRATNKRPAIPTPQRRQDFAKFTFHEVLLFFLFFVRFEPLFFARHFTSSMVRSHTLVPVGPVTIRPSVWRSRL